MLLQMQRRPAPSRVDTPLAYGRDRTQKKLTLPQSI